jgi:hypothetical protein
MTDARRKSFNTGYINHFTGRKKSNEAITNDHTNHYARTARARVRRLQFYNACSSTHRHLCGNQRDRNRTTDRDHAIDCDCAAKRDKAIDCNCTTIRDHAIICNAIGESDDNEFIRGLRW